MNKLTVYITIFFLPLNIVLAQTTVNTPTVSQSDSILKLIKFIPGQYNYLNVDILDNIYLITNANQLKKLNATGDPIAFFSDVKKYGNPNSIDVSNPLKIIVYYKNFATIVVLDRLLVLRNSINLRNKNIFTATTICSSYDNNIWIFDEQDFKIKKLDEQGGIITESADMRMLTNDTPSPIQIIDASNQLYLYDKKKGFYLFDYYGAFKSSLPFLNWQNVTIDRDTIYGFSANTLFSYTLQSLQLKEYHLPTYIKGYKSIKALNGKLYVLKDDGLEVYEVL